MIYFDTDVLVNYFVEQNPQSNRKAIEYYQRATGSGLVFCSMLSLMETSYVLSRLGASSDEIGMMIQSLYTGQNVSFEMPHFLRAVELARQVGFQNISDCLHTALAEVYCNELVTFNKKDFKRIGKFTTLKITIL